MPSAKDIPEAEVLRVLRLRPGVWHQHWAEPDARWSDTSLPELSPILASFPNKVLWAKLRSMARRGLIKGGGSYDSRCDWHVE